MMAQRSMQQYDPENWRTMDLLLMAGGKVNLGMKWSGTPLHIACNTGTTRMAELLLQLVRIQTHRLTLMPLP